MEKYVVLETAVARAELENSDEKYFKDQLDNKEVTAFNTLDAARAQANILKKESKPARGFYYPIVHINLQKPQPNKEQASLSSSLLPTLQLYAPTAEKTSSLILKEGEYSIEHVSISLAKEVRRLDIKKSPSKTEEENVSVSPPESSQYNESAAVQSQESQLITEATQNPVETSNLTETPSPIANKKPKEKRIKIKEDVGSTWRLLGLGSVAIWVGVWFSSSPYVSAALSLAGEAFGLTSATGMLATFAKIALFGMVGITMLGVSLGACWLLDQGITAFQQWKVKKEVDIYNAEYKDAKKAVLEDIRKLNLSPEVTDKLVDLPREFKSTHADAEGTKLTSYPTTRKDVCVLVHNELSVLQNARAEAKTLADKEKVEADILNNLETKVNKLSLSARRG